MKRWNIWYTKGLVVALLIRSCALCPAACLTSNSAARVPDQMISPIASVPYMIGTPRETAFLNISVRTRIVSSK